MKLLAFAFVALAFTACKKQEDKPAAAEPTPRLPPTSPTTSAGKPSSPARATPTASFIIPCAARACTAGHRVRRARRAAPLE